MWYKERFSFNNNHNALVQRWDSVLDVLPTLYQLIPRKHDTINQCRFNVGPPSPTAAQR